MYQSMREVDIGTCRGDDILRMNELLKEHGPMNMGFLASQISRGLRYLRSLIDECEWIRYGSNAKRHPMRMWYVEVKCPECHENWLEMATVKQRKCEQCEDKEWLAKQG